MINSDDDKKSDGFWDMDFMLPPKKTFSAFSKDTDTVEIDVSPDPGKKTGQAIPKRGSVRVNSYKAEPIVAYKPENPLVKSISVWRWPSKYTFYERFRADAVKYYFRSGSECPYDSLFSYMPQYMQLRPSQLSYYLWWRENARAGKWLAADYSYILLYIYEIINLPDFISPAQGLKLLCGVWLAYRDKFPKLDRCMCEWICDYCCINMLPPPLETLRPALGAIYEFSTFREFFVRPDGGDFSSALLSLGCSYNWRQSKFYNDDTAGLFETHIPAAFSYVSSRMALKDKRFSPDGDSMPAVKLTRDAYSGSLCAYNIKRRIDIEYFACSRSPELRMLITDIVKYSENQVRALAGIKSRFSAATLGDEVKGWINEYFEPFRQSKKPRRDAEPEYMRLYDAPSTGFTPGNAFGIEQRSWTVTEKLVDAFSESEAPAPAVNGIEADAEKNAAQDTSNYNRTGLETDADASDDANDGIETILETNAEALSDADINGKTDADDDIETDLETDDAGTDADNSGGSSPAREGLRLLLDGDRGGFALWAKSLNMLPESAAEMLNDSFYDALGDICVEDDGDGFSIVEDYRAELESLIRQ